MIDGVSMRAYAEGFGEYHGATTQSSDRAAVILNKNAKKVSSKVRARVEAALPETADIFFTESLEQARFVIRRVVDSGYGTIVTGGGDGTVTNIISEALERREQKGYAHCPRFAVLRLGTGNAIADFLGASNFEDDLKSLDSATVRWLDLLKVDGQRTTFGGFGWDAHILNNYDQMRKVAERFGPSRALFKTVGGYLVAGLGKSVPEFMIQRPSWKLRVINTGGVGLRINTSGEVLERIPAGATAFEGEVKMACFGTTPYYGYKMNMMPHANKTSGMFQLRLLDMHPLSAVANLGKVWNGTFEHSGLRDFQLSSCRLEFDSPCPMQLAGDAAGLRESVELRVDQPIRCSTFQS